MSLTEKEIKDFAIKTFKKKFSGSDLDWMIKHCEGVLACSVMLSKNKKVDVKTLKIASWAHDIGRIISSQDHAIRSLELIEKNFGNIDDTLKDCILNHSSSKIPKTLEGKIFQLADKMSLLSPDLFLIYVIDDNKEAVKFFKRGFKKLIKLSKNFDFK